MEPWQLTATEAIAKFKDGSLTVEDYARSLLARIERRDGAVKAWAYLDPEYVIEQAKKLDQVPEEERGPLHGVAVAVKDVIYTKGTLLVCEGQKGRLTDSRYANTVQLSDL